MHGWSQSHARSEQWTITGSGELRRRSGGFRDLEVPIAELSQTNSSISRRLPTRTPISGRFAASRSRATHPAVLRGIELRCAGSVRYVFPCSVAKHESRCVPQLFAKLGAASMRGSSRRWSIARAAGPDELEAQASAPYFR